MRTGLKIVTHCYAKKLPQYAGLLRAQLSSLALNPPCSLCKICVCYAEGDDETIKVIEDLSPHLGERLSWVRYTEPNLFRRSIGRNDATHDSLKWELFWFADCDYLFGPGCVDSLLSQWRSMSRPRPALVWPRRVMIHRDHATGDAYWRRALESTGLVDQPPDSDLEPTKYGFAIGGIQVVDARFLALHGYLSEYPRWRRPRNDCQPFKDFRDDVKFRRDAVARGGGRPLDVPGVIRARHTEVTYR